MALGWLQPGRVCRNVFVQGERPASVGPWRGGASGDTEGDRGGLGCSGTGLHKVLGRWDGRKGRGSGDVGGVHGHACVHAGVQAHTWGEHTRTRTRAGVSAQPWVQDMHSQTPNPVLPSLPAPFWGTHSPRATCACSRGGRQGPRHPSHPALFHHPVALRGMSWVQGAPRGAE